MQCLGTPPPPPVEVLFNVDSLGYARAHENKSQPPCSTSMSANSSARTQTEFICIFIAILQYVNDRQMQIYNIIRGTILPTAGRARCDHPSIPQMVGDYVAQNLRKSSLPRKFVLTRVPSPSRISPTVVPANDDMRTRCRTMG